VNAELAGSKVGAGRRRVRPYYKKWIKARERKTEKERERERERERKRERETEREREREKERERDRERERERERERVSMRFDSLLLRALCSLCRRSFRIVAIAKIEKKKKKNIYIYNRNIYIRETLIRILDTAYECRFLCARFCMGTISSDFILEM